MSALDELSHIAKHALWVSCMESNVPVPMTDQGTVERVASLLRSPAVDTAPGSTGGRISERVREHDCQTHRESSGTSPIPHRLREDQT